MNILEKSKNSLALSLISLIILANTSCSSNLNTTTILPSANVSENNSNNNDFKKNSVAFIPSNQVDENGIKPIEKYKLPDGVNIKDIKVIKASLDGRDLKTNDISIGSDEKDNIVFFIDKTAFDNSFSGKTDETELSIHTSETFEKKKQEIRTQLLQTYKSTLKEDVETTIATPDFLKSKVRGESLTRLRVAGLKKDASKLAKENIFIDRNLYIVLQVGDSQFSVKDTNANNILVNKFNIEGSQIGKLIKNQNKLQNDLNLSAIPVIAEKIAKSDQNFFESINSIEESKKVIEIEEIEEAMKFEIGVELSKNLKDLKAIQVPLDLKDLKAIESKNNDLAKDVTLDQKNDLTDSLENSIKKAIDNENKVISDFQKVDHKPISDKRLFDPNKIIEDIFKDFTNSQAISKFTYSKDATQSTPKPQDNSLPTQNSQLDYPFGGNLVIALDKKYNDVLEGYKLVAITSDIAIFPLSLYILKNGYLVLDTNTFKNQSKLYLYLTKEDKNILMLIESDGTLDKKEPAESTNSPSTKNDDINLGNTPIVQGNKITGVNGGKGGNFAEGPRISNISTNLLTFTLKENTKLTTTELKKLKVYEELFVSPGTNKPSPPPPPPIQAQGTNLPPCPP
ncbi:MAG: hypothetical protein AABZ74_15515, partial [Cyanobacteriota bacterium]